MSKKSPIKNLVKALNKDEDYRRSWKANIAMAVYDRIIAIGGYKNKEKIHKACNEGADQFLKLLCD